MLQRRARYGPVEMLSTDFKITRSELDSWVPGIFLNSGRPRPTPRPFRAFYRENHTVSGLTTPPNRLRTGRAGPGRGVRGRAGGSGVVVRGPKIAKKNHVPGGLGAAQKSLPGAQNSFFTPGKHPFTLSYAPVQGA